MLELLLGCNCENGLNITSKYLDLGIFNEIVVENRNYL